MPPKPKPKSKRTAAKKRASERNKSGGKGGKAAAKKVKLATPSPSRSVSGSSSEDEDDDSDDAEPHLLAIVEKLASQMDRRFSEASSSTLFTGTPENMLKYQELEKVNRGFGARVSSLSSVTRQQVDEFKEDFQAIIGTFFTDGVMTNKEKRVAARSAAKKIANTSTERGHGIIIDMLDELQGNVAQGNLGILVEIATLTKDFIGSALSKGRPGGGSYGGGGSSGGQGNCNFCNLYGKTFCANTQKLPPLFFSLPLFSISGVPKTYSHRAIFMHIVARCYIVVASAPSLHLSSGTSNEAGIVRALAHLRKHKFFTSHLLISLPPLSHSSLLTFLQRLAVQATGRTNARSSAAASAEPTGTVTAEPGRATVIADTPVPDVNSSADVNIDSNGFSLGARPDTPTPPSSPILGASPHAPAATDDPPYNKEIFLKIDCIYSHTIIANKVIPEIANSHLEPPPAAPALAARRLHHQTAGCPILSAPTDERISARTARLKAKEKKEGEIRKILYKNNGTAIALSLQPPLSEYSDVTNTAATTSTLAPHLRLQRAFPFWRDCIRADARTLNMIAHGANVPLAYPLPKHPIHIKPYKLHSTEHTFIEKEILRLVKQGSMVISKSKPACILPVFTVPKVNGDGTQTMRMVLDATAINAFFPNNLTFSATSITEIIANLHPHDVASVFDLSDAYYHIPLASWIVKLLAIEFSHEGKTSYAHYLAAPFGFCLSAVFLHCLLSNLSRYWNRKAIRNAFFGDDLIFPNRRNSPYRRIQASQVIHDIFCSGLQNNVSKAQILVTKFVFIGFILHPQMNLFQLKDARRAKGIARGNALLQQPRWSCRDVQKCTGCYMSTSAVTGNLALLFTRQLNNFLGKYVAFNDWDKKYPADPLATTELKWWVTHLSAPGPNRPMWHAPTASGHFSKSLSASDASGIGSGFVLLFPQNINIPATVSSAFSTQMQATSSVYRENAVVIEGVRTYHKQLANTEYTALVDASGSVSPLLHGSKIPELQEQAITLHKLLSTHNIRLRVLWQPRDDPLGILADALSRRAQFDIHDWWLSRSVFASIAQHIYKKYSVLPGIDLFADKNNSLTKNFYSLFFQPGSLGASVLDHPLPHLRHKYYIAVPPPPLLTKFISCLPLSTPVLLILPAWPSHPSHAVLFPALQSQPFRFDLLQPLNANAFRRGPIGKPTFIPSSNQLFHVIFVHAI